MAKRTQRVADLPGHGIQILGPGVLVGILGVELRHAVGRHQVDVGVRYVKTRNHQADSAAFGKPIEGGGDLVRHGKEMGGRRGGGGAGHALYFRFASVHVRSPVSAPALHRVLPDGSRPDPLTP